MPVAEIGKIYTYNGEKYIDPKINEVFEIKGKRYKCVKDDGAGCVNCVFDFAGKSCSLMACGSHVRRDGIEVIFDELTI